MKVNLIFFVHVVFLHLLLSCILIWGIYGTLIGMGLNSPLTHLGVSQSNFQVSPGAQIFTIILYLLLIAISPIFTI